MFSKILVSIGLCLLSYSVAQASENFDSKYDKDAKIIYKPKGKPKLVKKIKTSGYCCMVFDVNEIGKAENIRFNYCTHSELESDFRKRVTKFRFSPALINNEPTYRKNKTYKQGYVKSKRKVPIAGPNGYLLPRDLEVKIPPRPRRERAKKKWLKKYFETNKSCLALIS